MNSVRRAFSALMLAVAPFLAGCGTTAKFVYPHDVADLRQFPESRRLASRVAVPPFDEARGNRNEAATYFCYLAPLMPFGWGTYERPDAARMFNTILSFDFDVPEDLAKAAAFSLRKSNLFTDAFFTFGSDKDKATLLLEGTVESTTYQGRLWTYGLSVYGPLLWTVGLPIGTSRNDLGLSLKLKDSATGKILWEKEYDRSEKLTQGLYYKFGYDVRAYSKLMQDIMNDAVEEIGTALERRAAPAQEAQPK